jgi:hypothetical protein
MTQEEMEALLKAKIAAGEAETGLYNTGLQWVVVDRVSGSKGEEFTFQWFHSMLSVDDLVNV